MSFLPKDGIYMDPNEEPLPEHLQQFDLPNPWAIWPIIFIAILYYLITSEIGSQGCKNQKCNNKVEVLDEEIDSSVEMIDKINKSIRRKHRTVTWRLSFICAIIIALIIVVIFYKDEMINGTVIFLLVLLIFFIIAACFSWFNAHYHRQISYKQEYTLNELRHKVQE
jgi:hypothetical protein